MIFSFLPFAATIFSLLLGFASLLRKERSLAVWCFFAGMAVLGVESLFTGLSLRATELSEVLRAVKLGLIIKSFVPAAWLVFSLTYSRGDYREFLARWRIPLAIVALLPIGVSLGFQQQLLVLSVAGQLGETPELRFGPIAKASNLLLLVADVWILMNLEQTFRSAVGTMRWRIKFVVLGLAVVFTARLYVRSEAVLFSVYDIRWLGVESSGLLIGCVFLMVAYLRTGWPEIDVYPSRTVLRSSLTVLIASGYLIVVGILANVVKRLGRAETFQLTALVILLGMAGLGVLLLSDRLRQRVHGLVSRHFARAQHDSVGIWTECSRRLANVKDQAALCGVSAALISETFEVLSVTIWLLDEHNDQYLVAASTAPQPNEAITGKPFAAASGPVADGLRMKLSPFDLEGLDESWAEELRQLNPRSFPNGGNRWCVPLRAGEQSLGAIVLADRVNGARYTFEESQLLQCIAAHMASVLLKLRLANEVAEAREMEAFRTMSSFFVHDLKNTASSLNLMLKNFPIHFEEPVFRKDALRTIDNTARRIEALVARLTELRQRPAFNPVETDLNQLVREALNALDGGPHLELAEELQPLPRIRVDQEQIQSVITNLVLNARDALGPAGHIHLRTEHLGGSVVVTIADNGCGMSAAFMRSSLFRPFQSTKKKGLGIGLFQSRMIVEAHGGSIRVESEIGKGSRFRVSLPVRDVT